MPETVSEFRFKKHDTVGVASAEEDSEFLSQCFVDVGYLSLIRDVNDARRNLLGRTGSGKTALLQKLTFKETNVINIYPETCALQYISNSTILNSLSELGVNLDIFYKLLWRHVLSVELIKKHFQVYDEMSKRTFMDRIKSIFKDKRHQQALAYLGK